MTNIIQLPQITLPVVSQCANASEKHIYFIPYAYAATSPNIKDPVVLIELNASGQGKWVLKLKSPSDENPNILNKIKLLSWGLPPEPSKYILESEDLSNETSISCVIDGTKADYSDYQRLHPILLINGLVVRCTTDEISGGQIPFIFNVEKQLYSWGDPYYRLTMFSSTREPITKVTATLDGTPFPPINFIIGDWDSKEYNLILSDYIAVPHTLLFTAEAYGEIKTHTFIFMGSGAIVKFNGLLANQHFLLKTIIESDPTDLEVLTFVNNSQIKSVLGSTLTDGTIEEDFSVIDYPIGEYTVCSVVKNINTSKEVKSQDFKFLGIKPVLNTTFDKTNQPHNILNINIPYGLDQTTITIYLNNVIYKTIKSNQFDTNKNYKEDFLASNYVPGTYKVYVSIKNTSSNLTAKSEEYLFEGSKVELNGFGWEQINFNIADTVVEGSEVYLMEFE